jgi:hypothetical protein
MEELDSVAFCSACSGMLAVACCTLENQVVSTTWKFHVWTSVVQVLTAGEYESVLASLQPLDGSAGFKLLYNTNKCIGTCWRLSLVAMITQKTNKGCKLITHGI